MYSKENTQYYFFYILYKINILHNRFYSKIDIKLKPYV